MRIALFYTPPAGDALTAAAARWLGRDAFSDAPIGQDPVAGFARGEIQSLTEAPRRYGFHATIKPPFCLAAGQGVEDVGAALDTYCRDRVQVHIPKVRIGQIGPFFALVPDGPVPAANSLAADVVRAFDRYRAPLTSAEIERRRPDRLTPRQQDNLRFWGYPYVFDEYRFHMTLTGPVPQDRRPAMAAALEERFARFVGQALPIDALSLFIERDPPDDFAVETRLPLVAAAQKASVA